jgi:hypothetical protein
VLRTALLLKDGKDDRALFPWCTGGVGMQRVPGTVQRFEFAGVYVGVQRH